MRSQLLSVLLRVKVNASLHFLVSLALSLRLSSPAFSICYVLLSVSLLVRLSVSPCASLCLLVSLHKFVSSQKCGEIVVSLCVCPSARTTPSPCLCGWHLALLVVVVVFGPGLIYAHFVLWPKNAMRCTVNVLVSPRRLLCTALRPPPTLTHTHTNTHIRVYTHSLVVYTIKRKAC